jgi:hypothetical protein
VSYHPHHVAKLLHARGFSVQKPQRVLALADAANGGPICFNLQAHHAIPWNNKTYDHQSHGLVAGAKADLYFDPRNIRYLINHSDRHSREYHEEVRRRLDTAYNSLGAHSTKLEHDVALGKVMKKLWNDIDSGKLKPYGNKEVYGPYPCQ